MPPDAGMLADRFLGVIETDVVPLTEAGVAGGNKVFGAAILHKADLSLVVAATNAETENPLFHGEIATLNAFYRLPAVARPDTRDCLFLSTHEPCPLCLSAITWAGFDNFTYLFGYEDTRDAFAIPHDLRILEEVFDVREGAYRRRNGFWTSRSIAELIEEAPEPMRDDLRTRVNALATTYARLGRLPVRQGSGRHSARVTIPIIETDADVSAALAALIAADSRLAAVAAIAGALPLRRRTGGFEGLAHVVMGQQISIHAADAIWRRLHAAVEPFTPAQFLDTPAQALRAAGLSAAKVQTLAGLAEACTNGLSLEALHDLPAEEAITELVALKGIGRWTAESYLLFCVGHPDVFPAGDLALQDAVHRGLRLKARPDEKRLRRLAESWRPWRGVAARLFWAYYRASRKAAKAKIA